MNALVRCHSAARELRNGRAATDSASSQRATIAKAGAEGASSHCASSTVKAAGSVVRDVGEQTQDGQAPTNRSDALASREPNAV
jgi:hypothetical protein